MNDMHPAERELERVKAEVADKLEAILEKVSLLSARLRMQDEKVEKLEQDRDRWKHRAQRRQETINTLENHIKYMKENK